MHPFNVKNGRDMFLRSNERKKITNEYNEGVQQMKWLGIIVLAIIALALFTNFPVFTVGLLLTLWGIYLYNKNKKTKTKTKLAPLIIASGIILSFIGITVHDDGQSTRDDVTTKEKQSVFVPEMNVLSEVVDEELHIKGETNFPDETSLLVKLLNHENNETEIPTTVSEGTFEVEPIPIQQLKSGEQTYHITLAEEQPDSVEKIIGEKGKQLEGELIDEDKNFFVAFTVDIPEQKAKLSEAEVQQKRTKPTHTSGTTDKIPVTLVQTIDGDTIKVIYDGQEHNVRYLLIDTPETNHPRFGKQPFGEEAKERNRQLVNGGDLYLEFDVGERFDKYGRLLAYVYAGDTLVQEQLLKEGLARVAYVYPPNTRHLDRFEKAQQSAKDKKIGIWSLENYVSDNGFNRTDHEGADTLTPDKKMNQSPKTNSSNGDVYYKNCTEARKAGAAPLYKGEPGYAKHLDRDGDGIACE